MRPRSHPQLLAAALLLFIPLVLLQVRIDPMRSKYEPAQAHNNEIVSKLPFEFALGALTGFREAVAGLLWVRTDEFFHSGEYEAVLPMIRFITWLDPHWSDPYQTGAWHMDYNFTDEDQRSDRRYVPLAVALMNEGIANNPDVPDMYADLGFTHFYRKIGDFPAARDAFLEGNKVLEQLRVSNGGKYGRYQLSDGENLAPSTIVMVTHGLAHGYEASGQIPEALQEWQRCIDIHTAELHSSIGDKFAVEQSLRSSVNNYEEMKARYKWRAFQIKKPLDMHFEAQYKIVSPKVIQISGTLDAIGAVSAFDFKTGKVTFGPVDGCRVEVRLQDSNYKTPVIKSFELSDLNVSEAVTIMQDSIAVRKGHFFKNIDMSKDPQMYSFKAPKYTLSVSFIPNNINDCPISVQDRIGWLGEAIAPSPYLDTSGYFPGDARNKVPGLKILRKTFTIDRSALLAPASNMLQ